MIKVLIADDHPVVRRGLRDIVSEDSSLAVAGQAQNGAEVLDLLSKDRFDVLLLDITMPGRTGLDVLKDVKGLYPKLRVLMLSIHPEEQYAMRALKAGADGYLTKSSADDELLKAIRKVLAGGKYVSATLAETLVLGIQQGSEQLPHERLSDREYEVLLLIGSGKTPTEIAREMSLSVKTVSTYRARLLEKMGLRHNAELTRYVLEHRLA